MLVRAAGRKQRRHTSLHLTQLADSLYLPFLCPAQLRWNERRSQHVSQTRSQSSHATLQPPSLSRLQNVAERQTRNLATVAESYQSSNMPQYPPPGNFPVWNNLTATSDPDLPFIDLKETTRQPEDHGRSKIGIGGTAEDLLENVETNLRVERFERAKRIIQKLASHPSASSYLPYVHFKYLETRLDTMQSDTEGTTAIYEDMRDWFHTEVVDKQVPINGQTLVVMIRAALQATDGPKQERAVRRYYELALHQGDDVVDHVINSELYTDEDLWRLVEIVPEFAAEELEDATHDSSVDVELDSSHAGSSHAESSHAESSHAESPAIATADVEEQRPLPGVFQHLPQPHEDLPPLHDTEQKGEGLSALKDALGRAEIVLDPAKYNTLEHAHLTARQRQEKIEESASEAAITRWRSEEEHLKAMGIHTELDPSRPLGALMWNWYSALLPALKQELEECRKVLDESEKNTKLNDDRLAYGAHLESIPLEQVAASTILYVMSLVAGGKDRSTDTYTSDMKLSRLTASLGKTMQQEAEMVARKKADRKAKAAKRRNAKPAAAANETNDIPQPVEITWPLSVKVKLGAMLVSKLIDSAKITVSRLHPRTKEIVTQEQPAFLHRTDYEQGRKQSYLSACSDLVQKMHRDPVGHLIAKRLPMVIEPEPWTDFNKGGYLFYPNPVIRFASADKVPRDYAHAAIQRGDLDQVFSALNALGKIPWQINADVLRVQIDAWNSGEPIANFAPRNPKAEVIEKPVDDKDLNAMRKYKQLNQDQSNLISGYHSQRCFQNFQLEIARAFRHEKIYFPHNVDFRGRAYPIPPYLNHMGADNARALVKFAHGKELGHEGLRWLKIHLANVFGYDKASLQEREDFVMEHLPQIYDSATNPLTGDKWWLKSEDAWQTLAACYELKHALDSPNPTKFISTLPIHQDGTCNGLQHYAALGGDAVGARQVNLEPGDRPSDVYTAVAEAVKAEVEKDFLAGHPVAKILHGRITRKTVKQPVMTNVYGVTYFGARAQVNKQLEELLPDIKRSDPCNHLTLASYVAKKIFKSLGEMFRGAQAIQQWLGECADRISTCVTPEQIEELQRGDDANAPALLAMKKLRKKEQNNPEGNQRLNASKELFRSSVIWTTPLRLPVVQPYRSTKRKLVSTKIAKLALQEPTATDPVSKRKQLQGFPPNFIHSLDATHMMLSANKCAERGITFASIHDSFWTHASDVNDLSRILRDAFVDMHSEDIVGRLRHEFVARYKGAMYLASVDLRSPVGKKIFEFQRSRRARRGERRAATMPWQVLELLKEKERLSLLESEDPEERAKGEAMVTCGSIFAAEKDAEGALTIPTEITDAKLGEIPEDDIDSIAPDTVDPLPDNHDQLDVDDEEEESIAGIDVKESRFSPGEDQAEFLARLKDRRDVKKKARTRKTYVWLPLVFPNVPEKGDFDVRRLKESTYFFH
ncbi:hypothetical protein BDV97DRAFT_354816 [Delphinella strobiligena]|nr:hypothetical protein BDV97DRAFT_354816 [Delphinella strobiligena]